MAYVITGLVCRYRPAIKEALLIPTHVIVGAETAAMKRRKIQYRTTGKLLGMDSVHNCSDFVNFIFRMASKLNCPWYLNLLNVHQLQTPFCLGSLEEPCCLGICAV